MKSSHEKLPVRPLECPRCGCQHLLVVQIRTLPSGKQICRRECRHCGRRIATYQQPAATEH